MATIDDVAGVMEVLCACYGKQGEPYPMNATQRAVYFDGLREFSKAELEAAARHWMTTEKWWPMLSDLRGVILGPPVDWEALASVAWTTVERAIGAAGAYRGVTFEDPAIGAAVKQVFGSWEHACSYDRDSPGWAIKRQTFLAVFPALAQHATVPVTLRGLSPVDVPLMIPHVALLPNPKRLAPPPEGDGRASMAEVTRRFKALPKP